MYCERYGSPANTDKLSEYVALNGRSIDWPLLQVLFCRAVRCQMTIKLNDDCFINDSTLH